MMGKNSLGCGTQDGVGLRGLSVKKKVGEDSFVFSKLYTENSWSESFGENQGNQAENVNLAFCFFRFNKFQKTLL